MEVDNILFEQISDIDDKRAIKGYICCDIKDEINGKHYSCADCPYFGLPDCAEYKGDALLHVIVEYKKKIKELENEISKT